MATQPTRRIDRKARMQLPPVHARSRDPQERVHDFKEILVLHSREQAMAEASRCLHCRNAPCQTACPLHNDIPRALQYLAAGDVARAAAVYRETGPLSEVCGRVCPRRFCQAACTLGKTGTAIDTRRLEAFVATTARLEEGVPLPEIAPATGRRVAVVGAGPAGLAVAETLTRKGHAVAVFEQHPTPGGLMTYGIPRFKLDLDIVQAKLRWLEKLGVTFRCSTTVGQDITFDTLQAQFDAIFLGVGTQEHYRPGLPGEDLAGIIEATEFLCRANLPADLLPAVWRAPLQVGPRVHILGGGNTAIDCVRTALRLSAVDEVRCYYRRSEAEMPCCHEEYEHALEEGAGFQWLASPSEFLGDDKGRVRAVVYQKMELCELDASGRCRPVPIPGEDFIVETDAVVLALGYRPDAAFTQHIDGLKTERWGAIIVDDLETGRTSVPGLFAAGDVVRGADLLAPALANAIHVAETIDAYLRGT